MKMKKVIAMVLAVIMCLSLAACGISEPNYEEVVPAELQGVWCDESVVGILSLYAFKDNNVKTYVVKKGVGGESLLSGTYTVSVEDEKKIKYDFDGEAGDSNFTYEDDTLVLIGAYNKEMKKMSGANLMECLVQEETSSNYNGVICLADLIIEYYPDSDETGVAIEKKNAANAALEAEIAAKKAAGEAALKNLKTTYDKVNKLTWYEHKNQPRYADTCCYIYPYIGRYDSGYTWLGVRLDYTDAQTDGGWIFYDTVIFSVDGENTTKTFNRSEIVRDNDTEVWEIADFVPTASEIELLKDIANSTETIIRFQGDEYHYDHVVTNKEKAAIVDVLAAYEYLKD